MSGPTATVGRAGELECWVRDPEALWRKTPFATVVLARSNDEPLVLAGTSQELWELLAQPRTVAALTTSLAQRYETEPTVIASDVSAWLATLSACGAVRASP